MAAMTSISSGLAQGCGQDPLISNNNLLCLGFCNFPGALTGGESSARRLTGRVEN